MDPVYKVSMIPRGVGALGYSSGRPRTASCCRAATENGLAVLLGGRAAEMLVFNEASTGAADDLNKATDIARNIVGRIGMHDKLDLATYKKTHLPISRNASFARTRRARSNARGGS